MADTQTQRRIAVRGEDLSEALIMLGTSGLLADYEWELDDRDFNEIAVNVLVRIPKSTIDQGEFDENGTKAIPIATECACSITGIGIEIGPNGPVDHAMRPVARQADDRDGEKQA